MLSSGIIFHGILGMATNLSSPVYFYVYDHSNEMTFNLMFGPCSKKLGVSHGDEILSLFSINGVPELKGEDLKVSKLMVDIWTGFATSEYVLVVFINSYILVHLFFLKLCLATVKFLIINFLLYLVHFQLMV